MSDTPESVTARECAESTRLVRFNDFKQTFVDYFNEGFFYALTFDRNPQAHSNGIPVQLSPE